MKARMVTCLWFDGRAEEAARFYATTFPNSEVGEIHRAPADFPSGKAGDVLTVQFNLMGQDFLGLNGGVTFPFSEAISFQIFTDDQEETDRMWAAIIADGGAENACGWCRDRFGLSWQVVPSRLVDILASDDAEVARRGMEAMLTMRKIDIAALDAAVAEPA